MQKSNPQTLSFCCLVRQFVLRLVSTNPVYTSIKVKLYNFKETALVSRTLANGRANNRDCFMKQLNISMRMLFHIVNAKPEWTQLMFMLCEMM